MQMSPDTKKHEHKFAKEWTVSQLCVEAKGTSQQDLV